MSVVGSWEEMAATKNNVTDFTKNGECSNCGHCCGNFLPISGKEIKNIKRYVAKRRIKEQRRIYPMATPVLDMLCPFRDEVNRRCTIYAVRPAICQDFRCDKALKNIKADKSLYHGKYRVVDMREEFFGKRTNLESLLKCEV